MASTRLRTGVVENQEENPIRNTERSSEEEHAQGIQHYQGFDFEELAVELQNIILSKLIDDRPTILTCRGVTSSWEAMVTKLLEKQCLAEWTTWNPTRFPKPSSPFYNFPFQILRVVNIKSGKGDKIPLFCWVPTEILENYMNSNPFPARSLRIIGGATATKHSIRNLLFGIGPNFKKVNIVNNFMPKLGHNLTSLYLENFPITTKLLVGIFNSTKNLKALSLDSVSIELSSENMTEKQQFPALPQLKFMKIRHISYENKSGEVALIMIINAYAENLSFLELIGSEYPPLSKEGSLSSPYPNLTHLKILHPSHAFLALTQQNSIPLTHLSILSSKTPFEEQDLRIEQVTSFISNFSGTLSHLYFDVDWRKFTNKKQVMELVCSGKKNKSFARFPFVIDLSVRIPKEAIDIALLKQWLLPQFPKVESLHLLDSHSLSWNKNVDEVARQTAKSKSERLLAKENYWQVNTTLKKIFVWFADGLRNDCIYSKLKFTD